MKKRVNIQDQTIRRAFQGIRRMALSQETWYMTQSKSKGVCGSAQAQTDILDVVSDTGWREVNGTRVLTIVAGGERSELRSRWIGRMSIPIDRKLAA